MSITESAGSPTEFNMEEAELVFSDSSSTACAAVWRTHWTVVEFDNEYEWLRDKHINYKEMYAVVLGIATFAYYLRGRDVIMHIDNKSVQQCVANGKSKEPGIMGLVRVLYYFTSINNIKYRTLHLGSKFNAEADSLSRGRMDKFIELVPQANARMNRPYRVMTDW